MPQVIPVPRHFYPTSIEAEHFLQWRLDLTTRGVNSVKEAAVYATLYPTRPLAKLAKIGQAEETVEVDPLRTTEEEENAIRNFFTKIVKQLPSYTSTVLEMQHENARVKAQIFLGLGAGPVEARAEGGDVLQCLTNLRDNLKATSETRKTTIQKTPSTTVEKSSRPPVRNKSLDA